MTALRILEHIVRPAALGVQLRDVAVARMVGAGLQVAAAANRPNARAMPLAANGRSVWHVDHLPGLVPEPVHRSEPPDDLAYWAQAKRAFRLAVDDPEGRFLPLRADLDLPIRGLVNWPGWAALPQALLAPLADDDGDGPVVCRDSLPLFSAPSRRNPGGLAEIRAQLALAENAAPAAWALVAASTGGAVVGLGLADGHGRLALFMPWPPRPRAALPPLGQPVQPTDFSWPVELAAYWAGLDPATPPTLAAVMAQLGTAARTPLADLPNDTPLPAQALRFGRPLTLRTENPGGNASLLMIKQP
jgi:hypothetical protein